MTVATKHVSHGLENIYTHTHTNTRDGNMGWGMGDGGWGLQYFRRHSSRKDQKVKIIYLLFSLYLSTNTVDIFYFILLGWLL